MGYMIYIFIFFLIIFMFAEITTLKNRIRELEERLNNLAKNTGNENLISTYVSEDLKELLIHLKRTGKEVEAVKKYRESTNATLLEAKQYIDNID